MRPLNFRKGQHTLPEYLRINPKHKVPLLIVEAESEYTVIDGVVTVSSRMPSAEDPDHVAAVVPPIAVTRDTLESMSMLAMS